MNLVARQKVVLLIVCLLMLAFPGLALAEPQGKLVIGVPTIGGEHLDYSRPTGGTTDLELVRILSRYLIERDAKGQFIPGIAESWKMSRDGRAWDLFLRKDVKWHNGEKLTAADVAFGVERMKRPEIQAGLFVADLLDYLTKVEVVDDYHLRYHFKSPYPMFPYFVNLAPPMPKKYLQEVGDAVFDEKPVGMGPFKFVKRVRGSEYEFEAFDGYFGKRPPFKTLVIKAIPENAARIAALKTGEIDIAKNVQGKMVQEIKNTPGLHVTSTPAGTVGYIVFTERYDKNSPWADLRVRKAVALAIDRQTISDTIYAGEAQPAVWAEGHFIFGMPKDLKPYPYDPVKAKALLAEAGYPNGLPGVWHMPTVQSGSVPFLPETMQAAAGYLAKIGIQTKIEVIEAGAWGALYKGKKLKGLPITGSGDTRFDLGLKNNVWGARAESWSWLKDEDTNKLWDEQLVTADPEKRRKLLEQAAWIIANDVRLVPFVETKSILGLGPKVKEYNLNLGQVVVTENIHNIVMK